jgi:hypothetical protein
MFYGDLPFKVCFQPLRRQVAFKPIAPENGFDGELRPRKTVSPLNVSLLRNCLSLGKGGRLSKAFSSNKSKPFTA